MSPQVLAGQIERRTFRIYNVRRPAPPMACRLDIYDPDFNVVQSVLLAPSEFKPLSNLANTFQVDKVVPFKPLKAGDYHFVVEAQQSDDPGEGKDAGKWALERNQSTTAPPFVVFGGWSPGGNPKFTTGSLDTSWGRDKVAQRLQDNMGYSGNRPINAPWWMPILTGNRDYTSKGWTAKTVVGVTGSTSLGQIPQQTMQYNAIWVYSGHGGASNGTTQFGVYGGDKNTMASGVYAPEDWTYISSNDGSVATPGNDRENASIGHMAYAYYGRKVPDPQGGWRLKALSGVGYNKITSPLLFCNLLVYAGCNTAVDPAPRTGTRSFSAGNSEADMPQMSVHHGARAAVGIVGEITVNTNVYFQNELFKWLSGPYSLDAARAKAEYYAESAWSSPPFVNGKKAVVWYRNSADQGQMQVNASHAWWGDPNHQGPEAYTGP